MKYIDKKQIVILLSVVAMTAMLGSMVLTAYATDSSNSDDLQDFMARENFGCRRGGPGGWGRNGFVEVSEEYNQTVTNIAESDSDVQNLLADGYTISSVRPIIKTVVQGDGSVITKATTAVVMLEKDTTGRAAVHVDIENGKVTQIVILTRTVIDKS